MYDVHYSSSVVRVFATNRPFGVAFDSATVCVWHRLFTSSDVDFIARKSFERRKVRAKMNLHLCHEEAIDVERFVLFCLFRVAFV